MKIVSWNVNGVRAVLNKGTLIEFLEKEQPDIVMLQEVKAMREQVDFPFDEDEWNIYWNPAVKKGYSGVATLSRKPALSKKLGLDMENHDQEGRVITLEYDDFFLVNVYTPNSQNELRRLPYRQEWDRDFLAKMAELEKTKPVIFGGDLNVAHTEIDLARPKQNRKSAGFSDEERAGFDSIVGAKFVDTFRHFHPDETEHYSWWSYRGGARAKNVGWRIDYFCVSESLMSCVQSAKIHKDVLGSDHCPVEIQLKD